MKIIVTIILTDLVTNSLLSSFCHFLQQVDFEQVDGLVTRNIPVFVYTESGSTSKPCRIQ